LHPAPAPLRRWPAPAGKTGRDDSFPATAAIKISGLQPHGIEAGVTAMKITLHFFSGFGESF